MLAFATEDKARPRHWAAGVVNADQDAVIVLCEEGDAAGSRKIYAVELFAEFIELWWDRLTERRDEVVINIEREGSFFFVRIPHVDRVRVPAEECDLP